MKNNIRDIEANDVIYSKRSKRFANVEFANSLYFCLMWDRPRYVGDDLIQRMAWGEWVGKIPEEFLIFDTEHEKLAAKIKYGT